MSKNSNNNSMQNRIQLLKFGSFCSFWSPVSITAIIIEKFAVK